MRLFEAIPDRHNRESDIPDALFLLFDAVVAFDHPRQRVLLLTTLDPIPRRPGARGLGGDRTAGSAPVPAAAPDPHPNPGVPEEARFVPAMPRERFLGAVAATREAIYEGEVYQAVVSQRWTARLGIDPFDVYRALRALNPSPYLYFLETREADDPRLLAGLQEIEVRGRIECAQRPIHVERIDSQPRRPALGHTAW